MRENNIGMKEAIDKFQWIEGRGQELCAWFMRFKECKGKKFMLQIMPQGDVGIWKWIGDDVEIPSEKDRELGELMSGLRSCLDVALYEMSHEMIKAGSIKSNKIRFPVLRRAELWKRGTVNWLSESSRKRIMEAQRFGARRKYDIDIVLINELANYEKHRSMVRLVLGTGTFGQIGGKDGISTAWAKDLGLGPVDSQGFFGVGIVHGGIDGEVGKDHVVVQGPFGGLAIAGTFPSVELRFSSNLDLDDEDDKKRLARVSVVEAIKQAMWEMREVLGILANRTAQITDAEVTRAKIDDHQRMMDTAKEAIEIYRRIPFERSLRPGWSMRLNQLAGRSPDGNRSVQKEL